MRIRNWLSACALALTVQTLVIAQSDPTTQPRLDMSGVIAAGTWTFDWPDGAGGDISYGGSALGVSEDGNFLYIACNVAVAQKGIAKLEIPALGGQARVVAPCRGPNKAEIEKIVPGWGAGTPLIGGVLEMNGRMVVSAYGSYDASGAAIASHWSGVSLSSLSGPYAGTVSPGLVKDSMAPIPQEWRALLGGPAFATAGYTSIISRASLGAAVSVFDPVTVNANGFPMTMLLGCPHAVISCQTYQDDSVGKHRYQGAELWGGAFIVPGTRTLVAIEREADGPACYGYATRNPALHGQPYLDAKYCYSLTDPLDQKGPKGYPYKLVAKLYDVNELVAVKQGTKNPWDVQQYATVDMPGSNPGEYVQSGAYNPVRGEYYMLRYVGGGVNTVYVYRGWAAGTPPPPPPPTPPTGTLTVTPASIVRGENATLSWSFANATTATISGGIGAVTSPGTLTVSPSLSTSWTLDLSGAGGTANYTASVTVTDPPPPPPVNTCAANRMVISSVSWPSLAEGARQGRFTWTVPNDIATLASFEFKMDVTPNELIVTDSRGCTERLQR